MKEKGDCPKTIWIIFLNWISDKTLILNNDTKSHEILNSNEIQKILGYVSKSEVVHKDDMVEI